MSLDIWLVATVDTGNDECTEVQVGGHDFNYTHNVSPMWSLAGCYDALYNSDGMVAGETCHVLKRAIRVMEIEPDKFRGMNPSNGWGSYDGALTFLREWEANCSAYPKAIIRVWK